MKVQDVSLYYLKAFAIVLVALAHSCYSQLANENIALLLERLARVGVFAFLFLAGYFFHPKINFWKKKITRLFIPWLVAALWMYSYPQLLHHQTWSLSAFINYFIGNGSFLYFLTVLIACYILCWKAKRYPALLNTYIICTIFSVLLTAANVLPSQIHANRWFFTYLNPYLNIFNWIGIFALGVYFQLHNTFERTQPFIAQHYLALSLISFVFVLLANRYDVGAMYWSYWALPIECEIMFVLSGICFLLARFTIKPLLYIGQNTLSIYLYHLILIGNLCIVPSSYLFAFLRPVVCVILCALGLFVGQQIIGKISTKLQYFYNLLLGLSEGVKK